MYYKSLYVYIHDTIIHDTIIINSLFSEEQIISAFRKKGIKGRGGTSHKEVFDKIELLTQYEKVSSILFLTDFYSDIQNIYKGYNFLKNFETIWLITGNEKLKGDNILNGCSTKFFNI